MRRIGRFADDLEPLRRMVFNMLIENGNDHMRNHGLIATGGQWRLSPAYGLVPRPTHSQHVRLALAVGERGEREFTVPTVLAGCGRFELSEEQAKDTIADIAEIVARRWHEVLRAWGVNTLDLTHLRSAFLNPGLGRDATGRTRPILSEPPGPEVTSSTSGRGRPT